MWCSAWPWLCPLLRVHICHGPQLVNYWEIYLHGSLMGLLGNNWTCMHLWGSDISGLPGKLEELTEWMGEDRRGWGMCWQQVRSTEDSSIRGELGSEKTHQNVRLQWRQKGVLRIKRRCSFSVAGAVHAHSVYWQPWWTFPYRRPALYFSVLGLSPKPREFSQCCSIAQKCWRFNILRCTPQQMRNGSRRINTQAS